MCTPARAIIKVDEVPDDTPQTDQKAEKDRDTLERALELSLLAFLLWFRPRPKFFLLFPLADFTEHLSDAMGPALKIHDVGGESLGWPYDPLDAATLVREQNYRSEFVADFARNTQAGFDAVRQRLSREPLAPEVFDRVIEATAGLNARSATALVTAFLAASAKGATPKQLDRLLTQLGNRYRKARVKTTAGTEAWRMWNMGQVAAARQQQRRTNRLVTKTWVTAEDERVCHVCAPLDGVTVGVDEQFPGGYSSPPVHPSCRCFLRWGET